jgi:S1-C subfamily serine protease
VSEEIQKPEKPSLRDRLRGSASMFVLGVISALVALGLYNRFQPAQPEISTFDVNESIARAMQAFTPQPANSAVVYEMIRPSIVLIESQYVQPNGEIDYQYGSGVIVNINGNILTSLHVITGASEVLITFADGSQSEAMIVEEQPENDIAVVRAVSPPPDFVPATLGDPNSLQVGDEAYVVGHSFGLFGSMTAGVISGFERTFELRQTNQTLEGLIQIDAAVNPGNSGGPLLNRDGQVVGIVAALLNPTEDEVFIGIGFAVPLTTGQGPVNLPPY